ELWRAGAVEERCDDLVVLEGNDTEGRVSDRHFLWCDAWALGLDVRQGVDVGDRARAEDPERLSVPGLAVFVALQADHRPEVVGPRDDWVNFRGGSSLRS